MANIKGPALATSSPYSSDEASLLDTPSTNLTAFSPESASTATAPRPKFDVKLAEAGGTNFNFGSNVGTSLNDPFMSLPTPTSSRSQLSPTADVFAPCQNDAPGLASSSVMNNGSHICFGGAGSASHGFPSTHGRTQYGAVGEQSRVANLLHGMKSLNAHVEPPHFQNFRDATVADGAFTTDEATTRAFMVTNLNHRDVDFCHIAAQFSARVYPSSTGINCMKLCNQGVLIFGFTDYRDAKHAYANAQQDNPEWRLVRLSPKAHALNSEESYILGQRNVAYVSDFEGQISVFVYFNGRDDSIKARPTFELLKQTLSTFGEIKAFHSMPYERANVREIRVEYFDARCAENAVRSLNETQLGPVLVSAKHYKPDVLVPDDTRPSVTGRSTIPFNDPAGDTGFRPGPYTYSPGNERSRNGRNDAGGNHNQVVIYRIQSGTDVRTTIMLRNIPNKVNQAMLKDILDETSRGCYDFMYLRIDFANNCNVGYAFINFVDATAIIPFANARAGQRWNRYNSDKVAEISYATIQGRDCLVQKFRNSSVMLECPTFRPKLFITGNGPNAGEEEPFPPPDNPSKMRRSVENAEHVGLFRYTSWKKARHAPKTHVQHPQYLLPASGMRSNTTTMLDTNSHHPFTGLFAPRQGQMYREEQRRRRSQYDRGTPGAEFEAHTQHLTDPALTAYPSSSYPAPMNASYYNDSLGYAPSASVPSTWYLDDY